jgi:hypothetical protein
MPQCKATSKTSKKRCKNSTSKTSKKRCKNSTSKGSSKCNQHGGSEAEEDHWIHASIFEDENQSDIVNAINDSLINIFDHVDEIEVTDAIAQINAMIALIDDIHNGRPDLTKFKSKLRLEYMDSSVKSSLLQDLADNLEGFQLNYSFAKKIVDMA